METVRAGSEKKYSMEDTIVFHLKNNQKISFVMDKFTTKDVLKRLQNPFGVLKIGSKKENRVDLNQVNQIYLNEKVIKD